MGKKRLVLFILFGCLGITVEIFFTALVDLYGQVMNGGITNLSLAGKSYIWMFPIYGLIALLFEPLYKMVHNYNVIFRTFIYAIAIFVVEFATGWLLDVITGYCPWEYHSRWAVMGYIRLDYLFFWMGFSYLVEKLYLYAAGILDAWYDAKDRVMT